MQEVQEEVLEAAECARTGLLTAGLLAASLPLMANCKPMLPHSFPDILFLLKAPPHSRHSLARKDADFPNPQLPILPPVPTMILTTVTTNAPFARAKSFATRKSGHATLAGPSSTCHVSRNGLKTKGPLPLSNKVERMAKSLLPANGGVQDATFRRTPYPRHTPVGVRKRLNLVQ